MSSTLVSDEATHKQQEEMTNGSVNPNKRNQTFSPGKQSIDAKKEQKVDMTGLPKNLFREDEQNKETTAAITEKNTQAQQPPENSPYSATFYNCVYNQHDAYNPTQEYKQLSNLLRKVSTATGKWPAEVPPRAQLTPATITAIGKYGYKGKNITKTNMAEFIKFMFEKHEDFQDPKLQPEGMTLAKSLILIAKHSPSDLLDDRCWGHHPYDNCLTDNPANILVGELIRCFG